MPHGSVDAEDPDTHPLRPGEWRSEGNSQGWVCDSAACNMLHRAWGPLYLSLKPLWSTLTVP